MNVVLDASGATEILFKKENAGKFNKNFLEASHVFAPDFFIPELSNTMWKYYKIKKLPENECLDYIQKGIDFIDEFIDVSFLWQEAFSEGVKNNHSIYDMFYLVTAKRNDAVLITCDSVLIEICKKNKIQVC